MLMIEWYYLVIIAALFNAGSLIMEKHLLRLEHSLSFSASVAITITALSLVLIPFTNFSINQFQLLVLALYGVIVGLMYWMSARLFRHGSLSTGSPFYNVLPLVVTVVLALLLLGETLSVFQYSMIAIMLVSAFAMLSFSNKKRELWERRAYDKLIIVVVLGIGVSYIIIKYALMSIDVITFIFFTSTFASITMLALLLRRRSDYRKEAASDLKRHIMPVLLFAGLTLVYRFLLYAAISTSQVSISAPVFSTIVVLITVLSGGLMFGERHIKRKLVLSAVMIVAAYFLVA